MPFGAGSHKCVGTKFALAQIKMALVAILRHHTFALSPDTKVRTWVYTYQGSYRGKVARAPLGDFKVLNVPYDRFPPPPPPPVIFSERKTM